MNDGVSVLQRLHHSAYQTPGPFGSGVDGDETIGALGCLRHRHCFCAAGLTQVSILTDLVYYIQGTRMSTVVLLRPRWISSSDGNSLSPAVHMTLGAHIAEACDFHRQGRLSPSMPHRNRRRKGDVKWEWLGFYPYSRTKLGEAGCRAENPVATSPHRPCGIEPEREATYVEEEHSILLKCWKEST